MDKRTTLDKLGDAINDILAEYGADIEKNVAKVVEPIAKKGASSVNKNAAAMFNGIKYRRSWKAKTIKGNLRTEAVIYSKIPGLPHLLENGHLTRNGKRTQARAHIAPVEETITREFKQKIVEAIQK